MQSLTNHGTTLKGESIMSKIPEVVIGLDDGEYFTLALRNNRTLLDITAMSSDDEGSMVTLDIDELDALIFALTSTRKIMQPKSKGMKS